MSVNSTPRVDADQRFRELIVQFDTPWDIDETLSELRNSVKRYEDRYGMASEGIHDAIDAGILIEDRDVGHWIFQYMLLKRVEAE